MADAGSVLVEAEPVGDRCSLSATSGPQLGQLSRMRLSALACELVGEFGSGADPQLAVDARQVRLHKSARDQPNAGLSALRYQLNRWIPFGMRS
jgi:hypothetical protein